MSAVEPPPAPDATTSPARRYQRRRIKRDTPKERISLEAPPVAEGPQLESELVDQHLVDKEINYNDYAFGSLFRAGWGVIKQGAQMLGMGNTEEPPLEEHPDAGSEIDESDVPEFHRTLTLKRGTWKDAKKMFEAGAFDGKEFDDDEEDESESGSSDDDNLFSGGEADDAASAGAWSTLIDADAVADSPSGRRGPPAFDKSRHRGPPPFRKGGSPSSSRDTDGSGTPRAGRRQRRDLPSPTGAPTSALDTTPVLSPMGVQVRAPEIRTDRSSSAAATDAVTPRFGEEDDTDSRRSSLRSDIADELERQGPDAGMLRSPIRHSRRGSDDTAESPSPGGRRTIRKPVRSGRKETGGRRNIRRFQGGAGGEDAGTGTAGRKALRTKRKPKEGGNGGNGGNGKNPLGRLNRTGIDNVLEWASTLRRSAFYEVFRKPETPTAGGKTDDETSTETLSRQGSETYLQLALSASLSLGLTVTEVLALDERLEGGHRRETPMAAFWLSMSPAPNETDGPRASKGFLIDNAGASIGTPKNTDDPKELAVLDLATGLGLREPSSDDVALAGVHAYVEHDGSKGAFYLIPNPPRTEGEIPKVAFRIEPEREHAWRLETGTTFGAGKTIFVVVSASGPPELSLQLRALTGPCVGQTWDATDVMVIGRSQECGIAISEDVELSRNHCQIQLSMAPRPPTTEGAKMALEPAFFLVDKGSTNGTFLYLAGPNLGPRRIALADQLLIDQAGFTAERFEFGVAEEKGRRRTMEDRSVIVQDLCIPGLDIVDLAPPTFAGVFDGHGGAQASMWLKDNLHNFLGQRLREAVPSLIAARQVEFNTEDLVDEYGRRQTLCSEPDIYGDSTAQVIVDVLKESYLFADATLVSHLKEKVGWDATDGSTGVTALICGDKLFIANVGDSRALLCRNGGLVLATRDHKASDEHEKERVLATGGVVINGRVMGQLAVSRAFGDIEFKGTAWNQEEMLKGQATATPTSADREAAKTYKPGTGKLTPGNGDLPQMINAEPDVFTMDLTDEDNFVLLATDGLFDEMSNQDVCGMVIDHLGKHGDPQLTCSFLANEAIRERGSMDNVTVMIIVLNRWWRERDDASATAFSL